MLLLQIGHYTLAILWFDIVPAVDLLEKAGIGSVQYQTAPYSPHSSQTFLLNTGNALMISFCKLSKNMKTTHIPLLLEVLFCWSRQISPHLAMLSAQLSVYNMKVPTVKNAFGQESSN